MTHAGGPGLLVVTDLDATLLDEETYSCEAAREALEALRTRGTPLVVATSKTLAEVRELVGPLAIEAAVIVENGGAVVVPAADVPRLPAGVRREGDEAIIELGVSRRDLVRHLRDIATEAQVELSGFAVLTVEDVARLTGLPDAVARLARERHFDEPFVMADEAAAPQVIAAAHRRGLRVTRGGRFYHLVGAGTDKGRAFRRLLDLYAAQGRTFLTVGLGDAANDLPLLEVVDRPIIVPRPGGGPDPVLAAALPRAECAPWPGPRGWNAAVLTILGGGTLARVAEATAPR